MDKISLSGKEICEIIELSAKNGATELKFGDLSIHFGPRADKSPKPTVAEITDDQHKTQNKEALEAEELRTRKEQIDLMLIEDPALAERLISQGDLEDDGTGDDENS